MVLFITIITIGVAWGRDFPLGLVICSYQYSGVNILLVNNRTRDARPV